MKKIVIIFLISLTLEYKGVDLSDYDEEVDWEKLSKKIDFVIIKAGTNFGYIDREFEKNYVGAKNNGVAVGAYWYSYAKNEEEAAREAKYCLDIIKGKQYEYPIFYYIEDLDTLYSGLTNQIYVTFCSILEKAGYYCGVFFNTYDLDFFDKDILSKYTVWIASRKKYILPIYNFSIWKYGWKYYDGLNFEADSDISITDFAPFMKEHHLNGF